MKRKVLNINKPKIFLILSLSPLNEILGNFEYLIFETNKKDDIEHTIMTTFSDEI